MTARQDSQDPFHPPGGLLHLKASIFWAVLPEILFFSLIAASVVLISTYSHPLSIPTTLLTAFGTILGFVISYRTSSAYERYSEGRRLWASVHLASRSFSRLTWHHVPNHLGTVVDSPDSEVVKAMIEKTTMIHLAAAFCVALKHYLRGEAGIYYKDLYPLVCYLPKYGLPSSTYMERPDLDPMYAASNHLRDSTSPTPLTPTTSQTPFTPLSESIEVLTSSREGFVASPAPTRSSSYAAFSPPAARTPFSPGASTATTLRNRGSPTQRLVSPIPLLPSRNPPPISWMALVPFFGLLADVFNLIRGRARKVLPKRRRRKPITHKGHKAGENVPLEITLLMSGWIAALQRRKCIDVPTTNGLLAAVQSFSDNLTNLERVLLTPIPLAYSLHLRHLVWIYLFLLPSQLYTSFGWITVPATAIATFALLGLIQIGQEIESPFGYDDNDLDLDGFARTILCELQEMIAHPPSEADPANFVFVDSNLPFARAPLYQGKSAVQLTEDGTTPADLEALLRSGSSLRSETGFEASLSPVELRRVQSLAEVVAKEEAKEEFF